MRRQGDRDHRPQASIRTRVEVMTKFHRDSIVHRLAALLAALAVVLAPVAVRAQPTDTVTQARQHFQSGKQLFDAGDYRAAIREFEAANKLAPAPLLLFNIGLAYERLGEAGPALQHFKAYLEQMPNASNRSLVEIKIDRLQSDPGAAGQPSGTGAVTGAPAPTPVPAPTPAPAEVQAPVPGATTVPQPGPAASTGDPLLDRVAAVDVSWVRDQRAPLMTEAASAPVAEAAPVPRSKPAHKQAWFWIVVGVSALILIDIMAGSDSGAQPSEASSPTGATLLRF
jgi:tetratricopeptide (TPR) repeat protein